MTFDLDFSIPSMSLLSFLNTLNMLIRAVLMSLSTNFIMSFLGVFLLMAFSPGYEFYFHAFCITGILFKCQAL